MPGDRDYEFLPRSRNARVFVAVLALPAFLILTLFLVAIPAVYMPWPPKSTSAAITLFVVCELLAAGSLFTLAAFVWSIATPRWLATLLESDSRRLIRMTGGFLITTGVSLITPAIVIGEPVPLIVASVSLFVGIRLLRLGPRSEPPDDDQGVSSEADCRG